MQAPVFDSMPILNKTLHHSTIGSGLGAHLLINQVVIGNVPTIGCTTLKNNTSVNSSAFCTSLPSFEGGFKESSTMMPGINTDFQLLKLPIIPENQAAVSNFPLLSKIEFPCTSTSLLNSLPIMPISVTHLNTIPWCSDLLLLSQPIKGRESSFQKQAASIDNKLSPPHKPQHVSVVKLLRKTRKRHRCPALLSFVTEWINQGFYFSHFSKYMKEVYLFKCRPKDNETYDEHKFCRRVYLTNRGGNKYTFHYSLMRPNGTFIPQRTYALSSFKRIFASVEESIIKG